MSVATTTLVKKDFVEVGLRSSTISDGVCSDGDSDNESSYYNNSSIKIYYEIHGSGPNKILFIMGLNTTLDAWEKQSKYFGNHKDYQVCVFDNRGVGWSDSPSGLYSTKKMAYDAAILLNHIGWTSDINLVGISMGGMISQELILLKPHYFRSLCLTSTTAGLTVPPVSCIMIFTKLFVQKTPLDRAQVAVDAMYPEHWLKSPSTVSSHNTNREYVLESIIQRLNKIRVQPFRGAIGQIAACLRHYVSPERLQIIQDNIPQILVITGGWDNIIRPSNSFYLAEKLNSDFEYFEGSGHAIPLEQPDRYNLLLEKHFKKAGLI